MALELADCHAKDRCGIQWQTQVALVADLVIDNLKMLDIVRLALGVGVIESDGRKVLKADEVSLTAVSLFVTE